MAPIVLTGAALLACSGGGPDRAAGPPEGAGPAAVVEGMTMEQVLALWGTPNVRVREAGGERWHYWLRDERHRVVSKTYVLFNDQSRVVEVITRSAEVPRVKPRAPVTVTRAGDGAPQPDRGIPAQGSSRPGTSNANGRRRA